MQVLPVLEPRLLHAHYQPLIMCQEPVRHCLRDEAKEVRPDARPQARKNRRRIRWNTLRIFSGRARRRWSRIVRRSRTVNVGHAPRSNQVDRIIARRGVPLSREEWEGVLLASFARATRGLIRREARKLASLCARRGPTIKRWSLDARSRDYASPLAENG